MYPFNRKVEMRTLIAALLTIVVATLALATSAIADAAPRPTYAQLKTKVVKLQRENAKLRRSNVALQRRNRSTIRQLQVATVTLETLDAKLNELLGLRRADELVIANLEREKDVAKADAKAAKDDAAAARKTLEQCQSGLVGAVETMSVGDVFGRLIPAVGDRLDAADEPGGWTTYAFDTYAGLRHTYTYDGAGRGWHFWTP